MKRKILLVLLSISLIFSSCSNNASEEDGKNKIKIVASFFPAYDIVRRIGGDKVEVKNLTQTGSAHSYEPSVGDMREILESKLIVVNGAGFESWLDKIVKDNKDLKVLEMAEGIDLIESEEEHGHDEDASHDDHDHGSIDPHTWLSIKDLPKMAENIYNGLVELDEANKDYYEKNLKSLKDELKNLSDKYLEDFKAYSGRSIVVPHEAFAYLVKDLGIEQVALEGINSDSEPSMQKIAEISKMMKDNGLNTVFYDYGRSDKFAKTIAAEINGRVAEISTLEVITDEQFKDGVDLVKLIEMNLQNILESFKGQ